MDQEKANKIAKKYAVNSPVFVTEDGTPFYFEDCAKKHQRGKKIFKVEKNKVLKNK